MIRQWLGSLQGRNAVWLLIALVIVVVDQWSKHLVSSSLFLGQRVNILPVLDLIYTRNEGAAFSFLANAGGWQRWFFTAIALVMSVVLVVWLLRLPVQARWLPVTLTLVLGGAIGNVIDRIRFGYVEDFILVYWQGYFFPAFNVADMAITVGAFMLIMDAFILSREA
ncbi:MAG: signal peptidase II [Natronospirillum sp.]